MRGCVTILIVLSAGAPVFAQVADPAEDPRLQAEKKVAEAESLYEKTDYPGSLQRLIEARALFPSPLLHFNFGLTYRGLGRDREAIASFERFLEETEQEQPELAARRQEAAWHLDALRARMPAIRIEHRQPSDRPGPAPVYRRWWFWTVVGVAAAAAVGGAALWSRGTTGACGGMRCTLGEYTVR